MFQGKDGDGQYCICVGALQSWSFWEHIFIPFLLSVWKEDHTHVCILYMMLQFNTKTEKFATPDRAQPAICPFLVLMLR